jgi:hypothetical protein
MSPESPILPTDQQTNLPSPSEDAVYLNTARQEIGTATAALNTLISLTSAPQLTDENWRQQVSANTSTVLQNYSTLSGVPAPPAWQNVHNALLTALNDCLSGVFTVEQAVNSNDQLNVQSGNAQMIACQANLATPSSQLSTGFPPS